MRKPGIAYGLITVCAFSLLLIRCGSEVEQTATPSWTPLPTISSPPRPSPTVIGAAPTPAPRGDVGKCETAAHATGITTTGLFASEAIALLEWTKSRCSPHARGRTRYGKLCLPFPSSRGSTSAVGRRYLRKANYLEKKFMSGFTFQLQPPSPLLQQRRQTNQTISTFSFASPVSEKRMGLSQK